MLGGQIRQRRPGPPFQRAEACHGQLAVRRPGQGQDGLARVHVAVQSRPSVRDSAPGGPVLALQVFHRAFWLERDALGGQAEPLGERSERRHLGRHFRVVPLHHHELGEVPARHRRPAVRPPVPDDPVRHGQFVRRVVDEVGRHLGRNILYQRAAQRHIHDLVSSADAEQRTVVGIRPARQCQFQLVARSKPHHSFGQHLVDETWERAV